MTFPTPSPVAAMLPAAISLAILSNEPAPAAFQAPRLVSVEREVWLMGTSLVVRVDAPTRAAAVRAAEAAIRAVERTDDLVSTWRPDAELARLNRAPVGRTMPASPALLAVLREARTLSDATGGAFDPTVGALVDAWDLRGQGVVPDPERLRAARGATGWDRFPLGSASVTRAHPDAWLDAGAFGKGAALRAARTALGTTGMHRALLNFGGQILVLGPPGEAPRRVSVADPAVRAAGVAVLELRTGSIATSGQSQQTLAVGTRAVGHILDPRSGEPVSSWGSVTVVDADPLRADALATALFVLGPDAGWVWAEHHHIAALFVTRDASGPVLRPTSALRAGTVAAFSERTGG